MEDFFIYVFKTDELTAKMAAEMVNYSMPGNWCLIVVLCLLKYLALQRQVEVFFYTGILGTGISAILNYILVVKYELGVYGLAITYDFQNAARLASFFIYIWWTGFEKRLNGQPMFTKESFKNLKMQLVMTFHSCSLSILNEWAIELIAIISSFLSNEILVA